MKEIVLDTETTGISVKEGHRIVEIGCIELLNQIPTSKKFHYHLKKNLSRIIIFKKHCMVKYFLIVPTNSPSNNTCHNFEEVCLIFNTNERVLTM